MAIFRCPSCQIPLTDAEWGLGRCCGCDRPLPVGAVVAAETPVARPDFMTAARRSYITWALLCVGFLAVAGLILWQRSAMPVFDDDGLHAHLDRSERKLQQLEDIINSQQRANSGASTALANRLHALEGKHAEQLAVAARQADEANNHREQLARVEAQLDTLAQRSFAPPPPPGPLEIRVNPQGWDDAVADNVQAVCLSAAGELWQYFPDRRLEPITVTNSPKGPMVRFGRGPDGERRVLLNIKGKVWAQCSYQFSHEFCHILCNYRELKQANLWFEESLCETASLFALRRMAKTWAIKPPYGNWKSYSGSLADYADETIRTTAALEKQTLAGWFAKNQPAMRLNGVDRASNRVVAVALLKLLERDPHHWQAVGYLNQWDAKNADQTFTLYLSDWHRRVPKMHQAFVKDVAKLFDIDVK